jgi:hypothetical protein
VKLQKTLTREKLLNLYNFFRIGKNGSIFLFNEKKFVRGEILAFSSLSTNNEMKNRAENGKDENFFPFLSMEIVN